MKQFPGRRDNGSNANRGFTILELLVVITIVTVLMALIAPAISSARSASRQLTCQNNMKQLALAVLNQTELTGWFPDVTKIDGAQYSNWVTEILPWIDQVNLKDRIQASGNVFDYVEAGFERNHLAVLTCPADISVTGKDDLSYGAATGLAQIFTGRTNQDYYYFLSNRMLNIDLNGDGIFDYRNHETPGKPDAARIQSATSLFIAAGSSGEFPGLKMMRRHRIATVNDGTSNTIMLAENIRCGADPRDKWSGWMLGNINHLSSGIPDYICRDGSCSEANLDLQLTNSGPGKMNSGLTLPEGSAPWANSFHSNGVNIAYADGHVAFVSDTIDGELLFRMYTPQDGKLHDTAFRVK